MSTQITPGHYTLDPARSTVRFQRKTFWGLTTVNGVFGSLQGSGTLAPAGTADGGLVIDVASIDSKHTKRDTHLRSKDMLTPGRSRRSPSTPTASRPRARTRPTSRANLPSAGPAGS